MTARLTIEDINIRLAGTGITMIGPYVSRQTPTLFQCAHGHQRQAQLGNILRGDRCPICSNHSSTFNPDKEKFNNEVSSRGISLVGEYIGHNIKTKFECVNGHQWETTPASVLGGSGCRVCYGKNLPLTKAIIKERIKEKGYIILGEYINHNTRTTFMCSSGHIWEAFPHHIGCPSCASYGFNLERPAYGYILEFQHFIKFGISNVLRSRLDKHRAHNPNHSCVLSLPFEKGLYAKNWENSIKKQFGGRFVNKEECPDGWTETLPPDCLPTVIQLLRDASSHRV